jgi:hypothetical protein
MPKILINEKDRTSPGASNAYANYTVLIAGFEGEAKNPTVEADANGVYHFSNAQDFKDTIGLRAPKMTPAEGEQSKATFYHYGNQMAYELLNLGYSIVFKPIKSLEDILDANGNVVTYGVTNEKFWEVFKDKVSYDFRFITHGFLESSDLSLDENYTSVINRKKDVENAIERLEEIWELAKEDFENQENQPAAIDETEATEGETTEGDDEGSETPNGKLEIIDFANSYFAADFDKYEGFLDSISKVHLYESYGEAKDGTKAELADLNDRLQRMSNSIVTDITIQTLNGHIANLADYKDPDNGTNSSTTEIPGRGDCIALIELDERSYVKNSIAKPEELIIEAITKENKINASNGRYCAMTVPSVYYKMSADAKFEGNTKFPGAFHYLACFMNSLQAGFAEWYAAAGYTRGVANFVVDHTPIKLGEIAINALEPRNFDPNAPEGTLHPTFACNVIANFRGNYYLWGNRTAVPIGPKGDVEKGDLVAGSFLNIRQLCTTIKKQLFVACRTFTFDPNSDTLWVNFVNAIKPTLEAMKADQGIRDYKILKVYTPTKATLKAKIRIIPIEAVEDFDLEVSLEDSFGETAAVVTE